MTAALERADPSALDGVLIELARRRLGRRFGTTYPPTVSVVVPVFNQWSSTRDCLIALLRADPEVRLQVIVVDDASVDETHAWLARIPGLDSLRNDSNLGFGRSCNRGVALAEAPLIYFLNNDAFVRPGGVRALVRRMDEEPNVGVVGSKLLYPDGRLQEAGGIIWADANGFNVGRNDDPKKSEYCFARDVDYVSGASLMVRTDVFRGVGGFDSLFWPAYYEDADLCFTVRTEGLRVVYEPESVVVHAEGLTSGTSGATGAKRFQEVHRARFRKKWEDVLAFDHLDHTGGDVSGAARRRGNHRKTLLVIDETVPRPDRDAGSLRIRELMAGFARSGLRVVLFPADLAAPQPYTRDLQHVGIEVVYGPYSPTERLERLRSCSTRADAVWISRPAVCREYLHDVRSFTKAPIIYDTVDLAHIRLRAEAERSEFPSDALWREWEAFERACARAADAVVAVNESERQLLLASGTERVALVPTVHDHAVTEPRPFAETAGVLFIGNYHHAPNVDAATWLALDIMPLVWARRPEARLVLLGVDPPPDVAALAGTRTTVTGFVPDVAPFFLAARIFVAPLRFGAGVKGKIGQALSYALPVVTTPIGADGFAFVHRDSALIADDTAGFAAAVTELYEDEALWSRIAERGLVALEPFASERVVARAVELIDDLTPAVGSAKSLP